MVSGKKSISISGELNAYRLVFHCVKSACFRSYSGPYFPAFGLNTMRYFLSLRIQSECGEIRTRITPNTDTFYAVFSGNHSDFQLSMLIQFLFCVMKSFPTSEERNSVTISVNLLLPMRNKVSIS